MASSAVELCALAFLLLLSCQLLCGSDDKSSWSGPSRPIPRAFNVDAGNGLYRYILLEGRQIHLTTPSSTPPTMPVTRASKRKAEEAGLDDPRVAWLEMRELVPALRAELKRKESENNKKGSTIRYLERSVKYAVEDMGDLEKDLDESEQSKGRAYEDLAQQERKMRRLEGMNGRLEDNNRYLKEKNRSMGKELGQKEEIITRQDKEIVQLKNELSQKNKFIAHQDEASKSMLSLLNLTQRKMDMRKLENQAVEIERLQNKNSDMREDLKHKSALRSEIFAHHNCGHNVLRDLEVTIDRFSNQIHPELRQELRSLASRWRRSSM
jgi:chromosome segregation ATPase